MRILPPTYNTLNTYGTTMGQTDRQTCRRSRRSWKCAADNNIILQTTAVSHYEVVSASCAASDCQLAPFIHVNVRLNNNYCVLCAHTVLA